uniref:Rx N-terminal domain-containing protein n=1 Tax=Setaria viridis TaxID=4556 RepID=A0A4U6T1Y3_SETVI|nr:hypothetical protein SEVIR_9G312300v2 [Setaria viridis]
MLHMLILMAEMVSSAVVQETVSQILSGLVQRYAESNATRNLERLEMAHIRLEAALETSDKWHITDASLLRWRRKLKHAAKECHDALHKWKHIILEEEQMQREVKNSSLPNRIVHATKSFIFSAFRDNSELSGSTVQRFEWFADGAREFVRFVEVGGTPHRHMPFNSLIKHLLAGNELQHRIGREDEHPSYLLWLVPYITAEHGIEACLKFIQKDGNAPEKDFFFAVVLQISESTDMVGIVVKCLQLFPTHFQPIVETIKKELTQLPMQDFSWVPNIDLCHRKHWDNLHSFSTQWFRPDPLCCKQHGQDKLHCISNLDMVGFPDASLDSVILIHLQCQVSLYEYSKQKTSLSERSSSMKDSPYLKAELLFTPHGTSKDSLPAEKSSAVVTIYGEEQHCMDTDVTLDQMNEVVLPKSLDSFYQNTEAAVYRMLWKSKHGTEYIVLEKSRMEMPGARITSRGATKRKLVQQEIQELGSWNPMVARFLNSWVVHAPVRLRGLILDWIQKEKESRLGEPPLKFN